ncbi:MAG: hypothetical protein LQ352_002008 [Teloschistes flavicans]|nr:MAG: hypothetical protein LQ352_002008 [Teloschistes flavicans]
MTGSPAAADDVDPEWGNLASEQYLLEPNQERTSIVPTASQIESILQPWRTEDQRDLAIALAYLPAIWLRTCYAPGTDPKHEALIEDVDMLNAIDSDDRVLNNPQLYNFGVEWHRVFDYLPELLKPYGGEEETRHVSERQEDALRDLQAVAEGGVSRAPTRLLENLAPFEGEELEYHVNVALQSEVHRQCVIMWVVLEDEAALGDGRVAVMFLDAFGRVVRSKRVPARQAEDMGGAWSDHMWYELGEWEEGELGKDYQAGGACGGLLLESMRKI